MAKRASIYAGVVLIVLAGLFAGGYVLMNRRSQTLKRMWLPRSAVKGATFAAPIARSRKRARRKSRYG